MRTPQGDYLPAPGRAQAAAAATSGEISERERAPWPRVPVDAAVVITVHNSARTTRPLLRALHARTPRTVPVIVVDDASDAHTAAMILEEAHRMRPTRNVLVIRHDVNQRYTRSINDGFRAAFKLATWAVALNSDVMVAPGWLEHLMEPGAGDPKVGMVCPLMSDAANLTFHMAPGASYLDMAERLATEPLGPGGWPHAVTPVGACMAVRRELWEAFGPFDEQKSPDGYGEECELWAKAVAAGWDAVYTPRGFGYHQSHASFGRQAPERERIAVQRFLAEHGALYERKRRLAEGSDPKPHLAQRMPRVRVRHDRINVAFYITSVQLCGGILALENIIHQLNETGEVNATLAYEHDQYLEWRLFQPRFEPIRLRSGVAGWLADGGFERGLVFATAWFTGDFVQRLCGRHPGLRAGAFVQDREDLFRRPNGQPEYANPAALEAYLEVVRKGRTVVNSNWVLDTLARDHQVPTSMLRWVPIGVDTDLFYPRGARGGPGPVRVLSFSRPSTPRRGYAVLGEVFRKLKELHGDDVDLVTYDQQPGKDVPCRHLGKLPQARLAEEMARADILIEPSFVQGWGMPAQEMMASGGCVVSTDNGGIHNYGVHGRNCIITPVSAQALAQAASRAVRDAGLRRRLGEQARQDMLRLDWSRVAAYWLEAVKAWA